MLMESYPFIIAVYLTKFKSSHPHLLGLPVVVPYSWPLSRSNLPTSSFSYVGNGPSPTLVVYALTTPITVSTFLGHIPNPVDKPPIEVEDDVTYG